VDKNKEVNENKTKKIGLKTANYSGDFKIAENPL
jgi:hypothetical protein